jgi:polyhydroxybutyrate depolymerase
MNRLHITPVLTGLLLLTLHGLSLAEIASKASATLKPGDYEFSVQHQNVTRRYQVHVPKRYRASQAMPVVVSLHGGGGNMRYQATDEYYGMIHKSEQAGFIAVFPNGYSRLPRGGLATWNAGICCGKARDVNSDDVGFIKRVIEEVQARANVDPKRIFANGMSNGGMMAYRLACELPDTFRAIAAVAGTDGTLACQPTRAVSVLHIHAKDDERVLFNGGSGSESNTHANFISVPETIAKWTILNGCQTTPRRVLMSSDAYCDLYENCKDHTQVKLCVSEQGGHSWPGGKKVRRKQASTSSLNATDLIWEFYTQQP